MFNRSLAAALAAVFLAVAPLGALATQEQDRRDDRDGHSRYEKGDLRHVPLVLSNQESRRIAAIVMMVRHTTYLGLANLGVKVTSQDRVNLGGLGVLGSLFGETYDSDDFGAHNDAGTVFYDGDDQLFVALKEDVDLEDFRIVIFNADSEYQLRSAPKIEQISPERLAALGGVPVMHQLLTQTLAPETTALLGGLTAEGDQKAEASLQSVGVDVLGQIPTLREHIIGRAYKGPNNTLMLVVRPALVAGDEDY